MYRNYISIAAESKGQIVSLLGRWPLTGCAIPSSKRPPRSPPVTAD